MRRVFVLLAALVAAAPASNRAQEMAGAATFGAALQVGLNKAGDLIQKARAAGNDLLLQTGVEIQNAITSAQIAYEKSLEKTIKDLNAQERKTLTDIDNVLQTTISKGAEAGHQLLDQAQIIGNQVPFHNKIPLVRGYSPHFVIPNGTDTVPIKVSGNFPFGFSDKDAPTLTVADQVIRASAFDTLSISFNVPKKILGPTKPDAVNSSSVTLRIPWDASRWYHLFTTPVRYGVFRLEFGLLPPTPGKLTLVHQVPGTRHDEADKASEVFYFDSHADDIEENRSLRLTEAEIRDGWRVVPGTARFVLVQHVEGTENHDWYNKGYQSGSDVEVVWRARTEHKAWGSSGKIKWAIACRIARDVSTKAAQAEDVPAAWSMSKIFNYPAGEWKLTWTSFDGAVREMDKTYLDNHFLKVSATGDSIWVTTYDYK